MQKKKKIELDFLEVFNIHKNHNNVVNCNFVIPLLSDCWKFYIKSSFSWFFFLFRVLQTSFSFVFLLVNSLASPLASFYKLYIKADFAIFLCTEDGMHRNYNIEFFSLLLVFYTLFTHLLCYYSFNSWFTCIYRGSSRRKLGSKTNPSQKLVTLKRTLHQNQRH